MSDLLSNIIAEFEQWRRNKPAKHSPTPLHLRQQVVALLPHYPRNKITAGLRISGGQLKQWCIAIEAPIESDDFIELPIAPTPAQPLQLEVNLASGARLCFSGALDNALITLILETVKS